MIEIVLTIIFGIFIGMLFAHFYFRAKMELAARRFSDEIGECARVIPGGYWRFEFAKLNVDMLETNLLESS